jgi:hypothetical protein
MAKKKSKKTSKKATSSAQTTSTTATGPTSTTSVTVPTPGTNHSNWLTYTLLGAGAVATIGSIIGYDIYSGKSNEAIEIPLDKETLEKPSFSIPYTTINNQEFAFMKLGERVALDSNGKSIPNENILEYILQPITRDEKGNRIISTVKYGLIQTEDKKFSRSRNNSFLDTILIGDSEVFIIPNKDKFYLMTDLESKVNQNDNTLSITGRTYEPQQIKTKPRN